MSTRDLPFSFAENLAPSVARDRAASEKFAIAILTLTFLLSYLQYCFERNDLVRLVPVMTLGIGAFAYLLICPREKRLTVLMSVFSPANWMIIVGASVPPLVSSLYRHGGNSFIYGLVMIVMLLVARILLSSVGFEGLLLAFFYATTAGLLIVVGITFTELLASIGATRYAPLQFDPNRTGFFAVTAIPAQLWFAFTHRHYYVLLVTALTVFVALAASSRGSIGGLVFGAAVTALLYAVRLFRFSALAFSRTKLLGGLLALCVIMGVVATQGPAVGKASQFLWNKLALDSEIRGVNSGFTGRTYGWAEVLNVLPKTSWAAGNGFRTSEEDFTFSVDNGYLASLYELGLFSSLVILAKYLFTFYVLASTYVGDRFARGTCLATLVFTCAIFFANAFVHRVFLGYGEQASLLLLFVFVSTRRDVFEAVHPASFAFPWSAD